ncbi:2-amino-4-hydroxy-6-hydroxymethyldihydropteridine diphosphokinase [Roseovarius sp. SCSIO 43702]|uniref:2-amino-4-hydroxy-6- hydroxymethyldihydropteridine diphosphokinase n=1 Tax=Roseovarius sp. SCSIO 43702 TaxID=2823043 RepID=UPI001C7341D2|nr:2-amino-4-hydroxy-6-hydroxymethyldihydropteridine diphosphokinase [Roseovarius sp. SCSIO 43702]QYX58269.1 2-amino-4-hydroxy-6-hydroxymethyldihydropteridine diphosphokinase [Roseovarius sp. SCSIO 43702]
MHVTSQHPVLIALGANLRSAAGPPEATLRAALERLGARAVDVEAVSGFYDTPCFPPGAGPDYVNAAARVTFGGGPEALLAVLHEIEDVFGRKRETRWGRRTLDLDLIAMGDLVLPDAETHAAWRALPAERQREVAPERLVLPHPRLEERAFVLVPLRDVAPRWRHPVTGRSVEEMIAALPASALEEVVLR